MTTVKPSCGTTSTEPKYLVSTLATAFTVVQKQIGNMHGKICNLLADEGFDSFEALASSIAELQQKLDTAIIKKQERLIFGVSEKLDVQKRLLKEIAGKIPLA